MTRRTFLSAVAAAQLLPAANTAETVDPPLAKATQAVLDALPLAESDPDRPIYHFHPPANWTNDPNGTFYFRGWHHLFYQLNPYAARLGNQHWGHARSRDLVNWEHLPIAIWPSAELGEDAIYSGGAALAADGKPRLIYTSIGRRQPEQWMVMPKDDELLYWEKYPGNPVLTQAAHGSDPIAQWRDPFLFKTNGATYMVCGGGASNGRGQVQLYRATKAELTQWQYLGPIFHSLDREVRNFECPNLFPLDGKWVLIVSPNRVCEYWIGDLDVERMQFTPSAHGVLDPGDAYASNISVDENGRTLLWFWGRTNTPPGKGWGSVIAMPRAITVGADGYIRQQPASEFAMLRGALQTFPARTLDKPVAIEGAEGDCLELEAVFSGAGSYGLELRRGQAGNAGLTVTIDRGYVTVGNARAFVGRAERHVLRIFLDKRCAEVFVDDGNAAVYKCFDSEPKNAGIAAFGAPQQPFPGAPQQPTTAAPNPPRLEALKLWPMRGAKFNLDKFTKLTSA